MGVNGIYGLSGSGMDIESMVKVGMMSKQNEYDKMAQKFTKNEWMKADYIELNSKITTFNASTLSQYKMSNTMNAKSVESSSEAVKVSANSTATLMSHTVDVEKLSSNAYLVGTNKMQRYDTSTGLKVDSTTNPEATASIKLADVLFEQLTVSSSGIVSGKIARVDMTEDGRGSSASPDGRILTTQDFGKVDGLHWYRWEQYQQQEQYEQWQKLNTYGVTVIATSGTEQTGADWVKVTKPSLNSGDTANGWTKLSDGSYAQFEQYVQWQKINSDGTVSTSATAQSGYTEVTKAALDSGEDATQWTRVSKANLVSGDKSSEWTRVTTTNPAEVGTTGWTRVAKAVSSVDTADSGWTLVKSSLAPVSGDEANWTTKHTNDSSTASGSDWKKFEYAQKDNNGSYTAPTDTADYSWTTTAKRVSNEYVGTVNINDVDTWAFEFTIGDGTKKIDSDGNEVDNEITIHYSYKDLIGDEETEGKTFVDLVADINKQANGLNIKASYDAEHDTFSFYNTKSGDENGIILKFGTDTVTRNTTRSALAARNFFNNMGLYVSKNGTLYGNDTDGDGALNVATENDSNALLFDLKLGSTSSKDGINTFMGENGIIKVDGITYNDVVDNKLTVGGITYTAVNTTGTTDANGVFSSTRAAAVTVTQDADGIIDKVKSFITDYNKLLADLYAKYDEKPNSDYKPLTQSQKDQMKDEQITKWEEKAKQGLLYHDQTLGKIIMNMRNAVSEKIEGVDSKYNSIYSLGISTTGLKGQLVLDEDKLKTALANDPDAVYNVFAKLESTTTNSASAVYKVDNNGNVTSTSNGNGIAQRLGDIFVSANKLIKERAGSSSDITEDSDLNNLLRNLQTKMSNFKRLMTSFENALYKKYDAMESTLAKLGTQLNYIMGSTGQ